MGALKNFGIDNIAKKATKGLGRIFFSAGANAMADKISPSASKLLRNGSSEGGKIMNAIKQARKLSK